MKFDWELFVISLGMMVVIGIPIHLYIIFPFNHIMVFALGVVTAGLFLRWGMNNNE